MNIHVDAIQTATNIPQCMLIPQLQQATARDNHLQWLKGYIIIGWPENRGQIPWDVRMYWLFQDDMAVIERIIMKGRYVLIQEVLKTQELVQLHINHMGMEKTRLLATNQFIWVKINDDIERHIKIVPHGLHSNRYNQRTREYIMTSQQNCGR